MFFKLSTNPRRKRGGFTLTEMMISVGIGVTMLGAATQIMVELYKNFAAAEAYRNVHESARRSLALISKDLRGATNLATYTSASDINLIVVDGTGTNNVHYYLSSQNLMRTVNNTVTAKDQLTRDVTSIVFERWTKPGTATAVNATTYEIRCFMTITNQGTFRVASDLLQTRIRFRNKNL